MEKHLCHYGCGREAKYQNKSGNWMCENSSNSCPTNKKKNSNGSKISYEMKKRKPAKIVYENLPQDTKDKMNWNKGNYKANFVLGGGGGHKQVLLLERGHKCESCGLETWLDKKITLELEHVDGNNKNNAKENLKLLCPNCHSFTNTWKGKNSKNKKECIYVTDEEFIDALAKTANVRQALIKLGLTPKASNYERAYDLKYKNKI